MVEVSVDEDTGVVKVEHVWVAHDCGFAINPLAVEGQVQGAVWMGMGQALCEETQYHEGLPMRPNFLDYRIPTIVESPPIEVKLVESHDPLGPFGAKEASEGALHGFPPALTNAICDAIGIRLAELPATPDRVLEAIQDGAGASSGCVRTAARRRPPRTATEAAMSMERLPEFELKRPASLRRGGRAAGRRTRRPAARRRHRPGAEPAPRHRAARRCWSTWARCRACRRHRCSTPPACAWAPA